MSIDSKEYDKLAELKGALMKALSALHAAAPENLLEASYAFASADAEFEDYLLELSFGKDWRKK